MLTIRDAVLDDAERLLEIYRPYVEDTAVSFEYEAPTPEEFRERIRKISSRYPYLVIERDGQIMGYSYAAQLKSRAAYDYCCEVTIYLDRSAQKRGMGRMLYEALEERLREQGIRNLYACIAWPETPDEYLTFNSADFHAHMGYTLCGHFHKCGRKFDRWYDMVWMEKLIG